MHLRCLKDGPRRGIRSGFVAHAGTRPRLRALEAPKFSPTMGADTTYTRLDAWTSPGRTTRTLRSGANVECSGEQMTDLEQRPANIRGDSAGTRSWRAPRTGTATPDHDGPIRVVLADDSYLIREALREILAPVDQVELVATFADGDSLLAARGDRSAGRDHHRHPHAARRRRRGNPDRTRGARHAPDIGVIVLSQYADAGYALSLLEDGAAGRGYVLKDRLHDRAELIAAIEVVAQGGTTIDPGLVHDLLAADRPRQRSPLDELTPREREVLAEMAEGKSNAAIAESLVLTKRAVEKHVGAIFQKLGLEDDEVVSRRVTAVLLYLASASV